MARQAAAEMSPVAKICRRFANSVSGLAAVEFAMILPLLLLLLLATINGTGALSAYLKVRAATYALDSVINQYTTLQASDMQSVLGATSVILAPLSASSTVVTVTQIAVDSKGQATVSWSASLNGTAPARGAATTVPSGFATPNSYAIYGQVSYTYTPTFGLFLANGITLSDSLYVTPRSSACIVYTAVSSAC
jgi:Flp pilus assembly protein TadG